MSISFDATVAQVDDRLLVVLPEEASQALPSRGQVAVEAVLAGHEFRTVVEPDGRRGHWIPLEQTLAAAIGLAAGDLVHGSLSPTAQWPEPQVPADLGAALAGAPEVVDLWEDITPMARWEWVRWVGATRNPDTRQRRVEVTVDKLRSGRRRPCCFDLSSCTDPELSRSGKLVPLP